MSETTTITGTVVQILTPDEHEDYAIGDVLETEADGQHIVRVNTPDKPGFLERWREWLRNPGGHVDWAPTLVVDSPEFDEGEEIRAEAQPVTRDGEIQYFTVQELVEA